jgi:serine protease Do
MFMRIVGSFQSGRTSVDGGFALMASVAAIAAMVIIAPAGPHCALAAAPQEPAQPGPRSGPPSFAAIVQSVKPTVISVRAKLHDANSEAMGSQDDEHGQKGPPSFTRPPSDRFSHEFGMPNYPNGGSRPRFTLAQGSGFFISGDGYVVTNGHVVSDSQSVEIETDDRKTYKARVVGTDAKTDVALLKIDGRNDFPYVAFAVGIPEVGDWVLAVGNPYGLGGTVTAGIVSARGRDIGTSPYDDFIQIDAPVNKGNSGGPAFDESGKVVGVTTAIFSPSGGSIGLGFAIPADTVKSVVTQLRETGAVTRGWIGVQVQPVTEDIANSLGLGKAEGALVDELQPDGPASTAGIKPGDVIQSVTGEEVRDARDLAKKIAGIEPGQTTTLGVFRDGSPNTITLTVARMPDRTATEKKPSREPRTSTASFGLQLAPAATVRGDGTHGVVVTDIDPDGAAAERGVRAGDVILDVAGKAVDNPLELRDAIAEARSAGKQAVLMRIKSGESARYIAVPLDAG